MYKFINLILDMFYPRRCPVCHEVLPEWTERICPDCVKHLPFVGKNRCMCCGKPVAPETEYCSECEGQKRLFTRGRSVFLYDETMKASLVKYKYEGRREYGIFYGEMLCRICEKEILHWNPDVLIPVPLHRRKLRKRGFNQAEELARYIGRKYGIPVSAEIVKKIKNTKSQKKLDAVRRKENLKGAFMVCQAVKGLNIIIVDDVYTTGSTIEEMAMILRKKGVENVFFLTVCTGYN